MSFKQEVDKNKELLEQVSNIKTQVKALAEKTGVEIEYGADTMETLLNKISGATTTVSMTLKDNGAYTLTITKG